MKQTKYAIKSAQLTPHERAVDYLQRAEVAKNNCDLHKMQIYLAWAEWEKQQTQPQAQ
jgi:hypothetical protein